MTRRKPLVPNRETFCSSQISFVRRELVEEMLPVATIGLVVAPCRDADPSTRERNACLNQETARREFGRRRERKKIFFNCLLHAGGIAACLPATEEDSRVHRATRDRRGGPSRGRLRPARC